MDDDLFDETQKKLAIDFDCVVTAQQVGSYKPAPAHFEEMVMRSRIPRDRTLHVAQSLFHDIAPASALGYATVHVNRPSRGGGSGATTPPARRESRRNRWGHGRSRPPAGGRVNGGDRPGTPDGHDGIHTHPRQRGIHRGWNGIHYKTGPLRQKTRTRA